MVVGTDEIKCATGIRQEYFLNPALFYVTMDKIINEVRSLDGYKMANKKLTIFCYANDAVLPADSEDDLQRLLHKCTITSKLCMTVSTDKTKCTVISK